MEHQRANIINESYFVKIGKNSNFLFFNNLIKEIKLYNENKQNPNLTTIVDYFIDDNYCMLILNKISGTPLGITRNEFNSDIDDVTKTKIMKKILNIKDLHINFKLTKNYSRKEKFDMYFNKVNKILDKNMNNKLKRLYNQITLESSEYVTSHSDLILPNIMLEDDKIIFIDWEYISLKPRYYDLAYFLLFSKDHNCLNDISENIDYKELYNDAVIICLKELNNWIKLYNELDKNLIDNKIKRWKKELIIILDAYFDLI